MNGYKFKAKTLSFWSFRTFPWNSRGKNSIIRAKNSSKYLFFCPLFHRVGRKLVWLFHGHGRVFLLLGPGWSRHPWGRAACGLLLWRHHDWLWRHGWGCGGVSGLKGGTVLWRYDAGVAGLCKPGKRDENLWKKEMPLKSRHPYRAKVISKQDFPKSSQNSRTHTLPKVSMYYLLIVRPHFSAVRKSVVIWKVSDW